VDIIIIITGKGWVISPDRAKFGVAPRGAGVEIQNYVSYVLQTHKIYIDVGPMVMLITVHHRLPPSSKWFYAFMWPISRFVNALSSQQGCP